MQQSLRALVLRNLSDEIRRKRNYLSENSTEKNMRTAEFLLGIQKLIDEHRIEIDAADGNTLD